MNIGAGLLENLQYAWAYLWSGRTLAIVLGIAFAMLAIGLGIASRTRWGKTKPLTKCVVLSVIAHVWLLIYASGTRIMLPQGDPQGAMHSLAVSLDAARNEPAGPTAALDAVPDEELHDEASNTADLSAWERPLDSSRLPIPDIMAQAPPIDVSLSPADLLGGFDPEPLPELPPEMTTINPALSNQELLSSAAVSADESNVTTPTVPTVLPPVSADAVGPNDRLADDANSTASLVSLPSSQPLSLPTASAAPPAEYQLRQAADRLELARPFGADQDTEAAVAAALQWLSRAQSRDGCWNAKEHGGGTETYALGENRSGTGDRADTGVTGLALLAFLSAGHTHTAGEYQDTVLRGLDYLVRCQWRSGDLSGPKQVGHDASVTNARMYCHGIATLALAEAYAMTHDQRLRQPLELAIQFTLDAQDPRGGGWRYRPGDPGDLSQFGWQAMALRSAERSGLRIDPQRRQRMLMFLDSCAVGAAGGLARYRPHEGRPSPTMTAEALACRMLLNHRGTRASQIEARNYLLDNLPGNGPDNVYYWYYATLAMFQLQDPSWQRWNMAMKAKLVTTQRPAYDSHAGSWDPDALWGGYGGRVYSTAMSCLCLEVYYRYLPLFRD